MFSTSRDVKIGNYIESLEAKSNAIFDDFIDFSDGCRMLILLERKKDGGHNKEERRTLQTRFTFSPEEYKRAIKEMLLLRLLNPEARLYASVNSRNIKKVIQQVETELLWCHYSDEVNRLSTYKKLIKSARHFVMQQTCANDSLFIIDADNIEGRDIYAEVLIKCAKLNIDIVKCYKTKNGWHIVTKPFNPNLWDSSFGEIKKDGLILLDY